MTATPVRPASTAEPTVLFDAPGPIGRWRNLIITLLGWLALAGAALALVRGLREQFTVEKVSYLFSTEAWQSNLWPGLINTVQAAVISVITSTILGFLLGAGRLSGFAWVRGIATVIVEFFRAVPVLIMMVFAWNLAIRNLGLTGNLASLLGVIIGLTLYNGSVIAELLRSGVHSLPKGQTEAGLAVGMSRGQVLRSIQLPQAVAAMLPSLISQLVVILKDTALGSIILYPDLLNQANQIATGRGNLVASLLLAAVLYIVINFGLTTLASKIEKTLRRRRRTAAPPPAVPTGLTPTV